MSDLLPTLIQIFLTIKLGWLAGFYKIIPPTDAKGIIQILPESPPHALKRILI